MFFSREKKDSKEPKKRSTFGLLFNPEFGRDIKPIGESMGMFVRLIAMIFASNKLFPKDHPALMGVQGARLTMGEVITTAWRGLTFTREGLPKVILFFAVVGMLVFTALFVLALFASLFVGKAHAAGMFEAPGGSDPASTTDLAISWLAYLFQGVTPNSNVSGAGQTMLSSTSLQSALYSALRFYSNAILVFGGIILLYHLLSMVAETAHHGAVMGKRASQIWAPIRLVVAIGLLVPISTGVGLNTGQYIVIQMAKWGSGLASNVWGTIATGLGNTQFTIPPSALPAGIDRTVNDLIRIRACAWAFNAEATAGQFDLSYMISERTSGTIEMDPACADLPGELQSAGCYITNPIPTRHRFTNDHANNICGYYDVAPNVTNANPVLQSMLSQIRQFQNNAMIVADAEIDLVAQNVLLYVSQPAQGGGYLHNGYRPEVAIRAYKTSLSNSLASLQGNWDTAIQNMAQNWSNQGWVTAGAWFNTVARLQGSVIGTIESTLPVTSVPKGGIDDPSWTDKVDWNVWAGLMGHGAAKSIYDNTAIALEKFEKNIIATTPPQLGPTQQQQAQSGLPAPAPGSGSWTVGKALTAVDWVGRALNIWPSGDGLIINFGTTTNPFAELVNLGYSYTKFGIELLTWGMGGKIASNLLSYIPVLGGMAKEIGGFAAGVVLAIGATFLSCGIALAFIVPLIPFMKFFFNIITWLLNVFEAIIAAPLFALAHLNPEGEGLPGSMARTGYFFLLSILLRPVMMIFGLIAGLLLFFVVISFLNASFNIAVQGSGSAGGQLAVLSRVIFSVMYVLVAYTAANKCFQSISFFTEHTMKWMGVGGPETRQMGDRQMMHGITGAMGSYMVANWMQNAAGSIGGSLSKQPAAVSNEGIAAALRDNPAGRGGNTGQIPSAPNAGPIVGMDPRRPNPLVSSDVSSAFAGTGGSGAQMALPREIPEDPVNIPTGPQVIAPDTGDPAIDNPPRLPGVSDEQYEASRTEGKVEHHARGEALAALAGVRAQPGWANRSLNERQFAETQAIENVVRKYAQHLQDSGGDIRSVTRSLNDNLLSRI